MLVGEMVGCGERATQQRAGEERGAGPGCACGMEQKEGEGEGRREEKEKKRKMEKREKMGKRKKKRGRERKREREPVRAGGDCGPVGHARCDVRSDDARGARRNRGDGTVVGFGCRVSFSGDREIGRKNDLSSTTKTFAKQI